MLRVVLVAAAATSAGAVRLLATKTLSSQLPPGELPSFLATAALSDASLLGAETFRPIALNGEEDGSTYECEMASINFFALKITPLFITRIERTEVQKDRLTIRVLEGSVQKPAKGDALPEAEQGARIDACNLLRWEGGVVDGWTVSSELTVGVDLNLPIEMSGVGLSIWRRAGDAIVGAACSSGWCE